MPDHHRTTGAILAGGRGSRMGGEDKGLILAAGRSLVEHVFERLRPQVDATIIVANRSRDAYRRLGVPVVSDAQADYRGPLAGMASALQAAATPYVLVVPCDAPLLPPDLHARLTAGLGAADIAVALHADRIEPLFALLHRELLPDLQNFLKQGGRAVHQWYGRHAVAEVAFPLAGTAFSNVNTAADLKAFEARAGDDHGSD